MRMESIIKKIFSGKGHDEEVHSAFVKFSKGIFSDRYLIEAKKQKDKWSIKTSNEFANFFVRKCLEQIHGEIDITGAIISTFDIRQGMGGHVFNPEEEVKQFMGIKQLKVNGRIDAKKVLLVMDKYPKAFCALSFKTADCELKIKAKAPKSAKPSSKGDGKPKADFCSLKTSNREIAHDLFFDCPEFKEIIIKHDIIINDIELPKGETDPVKLRENAKRKGIVKRIVLADGRETIKEAEFFA